MSHGLGAARGGIGSLAEILDEYWDEVEADFQRFYGYDLRVEVGRAGLRRLFALIAGLGTDAALWRSMREKEGKQGGRGGSSASQPRAGSQTRTQNPEEIREFFARHAIG